MVRRLFGATAEALIIVILIFGLLAVPVLAAKGGIGGGGGGGGDRVLPGGTCAVAPNPTAVGDVYTVTGSGLAPGHQVMVQVANAQGTQVLFSSTDASGVLAPASGYAYWSGAHNVSIVYNARKPVTLTACGFDVS